jgi:hypothetical protein
MTFDPMLRIHYMVVGETGDVKGVDDLAEMQKLIKAATEFPEAWMTKQSLD